MKHSGRREVESSWRRVTNRKWRLLPCSLILLILQWWRFIRQTSIRRSSWISRVALSKCRASPYGFGQKNSGYPGYENHPSITRFCPSIRRLQGLWWLILPIIRVSCLHMIEIFVQSISVSMCEHHPPIPRSGTCDDEWSESFWNIMVSCMSTYISCLLLHHKGKLQIRRI
jgi:hypothetical protein